MKNKKGTYWSHIIIEIIGFGINCANIVRGIIGERYLYVGISAFLGLLLLFFIIVNIYCLANCED